MRSEGTRTPARSGIKFTQFTDRRTGTRPGRRLALEMGFHSHARHHPAEPGHRDCRPVYRSRRSDKRLSGEQFSGPRSYRPVLGAVAAADAGNGNNIARGVAGAAANWPLLGAPASAFRTSTVAPCGRAYMKGNGAVSEAAWRLASQSGGWAAFRSYVGQSGDRRARRKEPNRMAPAAPRRHCRRDRGQQEYCRVPVRHVHLRSLPGWRHGSARSAEAHAQGHGSHRGCIHPCRDGARLKPRCASTAP